MNILPIIVLIFLMLKDKFDFSNLLDGVDINSLLPIFELLNVDPSIINTLNNDNFKDLMNGNLDLKTLLPVILPMLTSLKKPTSTEFNETSATFTYSDFSPIKDIAGQNVTTAFESYFDGDF